MSAARALQPVLTDADIADRIDAYVQRNVSPMVAAERVVADLCREGLAEAAIQHFGPPMLFEVWEDVRRPPKRGPKPREVSIKRAAELRTLREAGGILETLVQIDGRWLRLGDLNKAACLKLAAANKRQALTVAAQARFYHAIAQRLQDGGRVRDHLNDATLARIREEAGQ